MFGLACINDFFTYELYVSHTITTSSFYSTNSWNLIFQCTLSFNYTVVPPLRDHSRESVQKSTKVPFVRSTLLITKCMCPTLFPSRQSPPLLKDHLSHVPIRVVSQKGYNHCIVILWTMVVCRTKWPPAPVH